MKVAELAPLWAAFEQAATALDEEAGGLTKLLDKLEDALIDASLYDRIAALLSQLDNPRRDGDEA
jgi:hypothetical protein